MILDYFFDEHHVGNLSEMAKYLFSAALNRSDKADKNKLGEKTWIFV